MIGKIFQEFARNVRIVRKALFVRPLELLYRNGPVYIGMWQGMSDANICYELTAVEALFWSNNDDQCADLIERHFHSFLTLVYAAFVAWMMYTAYSASWYYFAVIRPMNRNFDRLGQFVGNGGGYSIVRMGTLGPAVGTVEPQEPSFKK
jgi:hypothetical protein